MGASEDSRLITRTEPVPAESAAAFDGRCGRQIAVIVYHRDGVEVALLRPDAGVVIGRCATAHVRIADTSLSREHARFTLVGERVLVEDLGSTNGTWCSGERVHRAHLAVGDDVMLGGLLGHVQVLGASTVRHDDGAEVGVEAILAGPVMSALLETVRLVAGSRIPVLLLGETGSGKEVLARLIHEHGPRRAHRLVHFNCAAIPGQLVESTLFGHERGSFTGALHQQRGVFEEANGGTVLLDEVGELPPAAQAALLRVLETGTFCRVGSSREIEVSVRILAATHRDLEAMVAAGAFRADLYYRLNAMCLSVPPLRERVAEIEPLAARFLRLANELNGRALTGLAPEALARLRAYPWPGNVRELKNAIERAVLVARGATIGVADLPPRLLAASHDERAPGPVKASAVAGALASLAGAFPNDGADVEVVGPPCTEDPGDLRARVQRYEARVIAETLEATGWSRTKAAQQLGMPLRTLRHRMKLLGLRKPGRSA